MESGQQSMSFTLVKGSAVVGVANPRVLEASEWSPGGARGAASAGPHGWGYMSIGGVLKHDGKLSDWPGQRGARQGDVITLHLDLETGELFVELKSAEAEPTSLEPEPEPELEMEPEPEPEPEPESDKVQPASNAPARRGNALLGRIATGLKPPLVWCVELCNAGSSCALAPVVRPSPPPTPHLHLPYAHSRARLLVRQRPSTGAQ